MKITLILINFICLIIAVTWLILEKSWEPLLTTLGLLATLISLVYSKPESKVYMKQKGGKRSKNYQSARDINIHQND